MACRLFCAAAVVCLAVSLAAAQDPTKAEPKHYKLHFDNDHVVVIDIHYGPHEKSDLHDHPGGVVVNLTAGHLKFTDQNGKITEVYAKAGESRWFPPVKHKVENLGDETYNAVYIAIKSKTATASVLKQDSAVSAGQIAQILPDYARTPAKPSQPVANVRPAASP
jgi:quercetin dioxygenase-like cupin family protein